LSSSQPASFAAFARLAKRKRGSRPRVSSGTADAFEPYDAGNCPYTRNAPTRIGRAESPGGGRIVIFRRRPADRPKKLAGFARIQVVSDPPGPGRGPRPAPWTRRTTELFVGDPGRVPARPSSTKREPPNGDAKSRPCARIQGRKTRLLQVVRRRRSGIHRGKVVSSVSPYSRLPLAALTDSLDLPSANRRGGWAGAACEIARTQEPAITPAAPDRRPFVSPDPARSTPR